MTNVGSSCFAVNVSIVGKRLSQTNSCIFYRPEEVIQGPGAHLC